MTLDFSRTATALEAYDRVDAGFEGLLAKADLTDEDIGEFFDRLDEHGRAVGEAFGLDTADRNDLQTCIALVRPGPWVRGIVKEWEESRG